MNKRQVLEEAKCHLVGAIINAVSTIGGSAANARQGAKNRQTQLAAAAMENQPKGGTDDYQPTALSEMANQDSSDDINQKSLQDIVQTNKSPFQFSSAGQPPGADSRDSYNFGNPTNLRTGEDMTVPKSQGEPPQQQSQGLSTNNYVQLAGTAANLASSLAQRPNAPAAQIPQPGQMNYQPTALAIMARRNPYGGY